MTEFQFDISEEDRDAAYGMVRQKFAMAHNMRWIRQENPPEYFFFHTGRVKGTISLISGISGTQVKGTVDNQSSFLIGLIMALIVGYIFYGVLGAIMFTVLVMAISLPLNTIMRGKHRKNIGPKLCAALQGTNFQQI